MNINKGISFVFHNTVEIRYFVLEVPNGLLWLLFIGCCVLVYQFCLAKATTSFFLDCDIFTNVFGGHIAANGSFFGLFVELFCQAMFGMSATLTSCTVQQ